MNLREWVLQLSLSRPEKTPHHTAMAFGHIILAILAIISFVPFVRLQMTGSGFCFFLSSYKEVIMNTASQSCIFAQGEVIKFLCALVLVWFVLVVYYWVKARLGIGAKLDSVWLNLIQLFFIVLLLTVAFSCAVIITSGLNHAREPHLSGRYQNFINFSFNVSNKMWITIPATCLMIYIPMRSLGIIISVIYFLTSSDLVTFNISNKEPANFCIWICVAEISAWFGVSILGLMFIATISSFVGHLCKTEPIPTNM